MRENNKHACSMCGKFLDDMDKQSGFSIDKVMGYGSEYDGEHIVIQLCCDCTDKIIAKCQETSILA